VEASLLQGLTEVSGYDSAPKNRNFPVISLLSGKSVEHGSLMTAFTASK